MAERRVCGRQLRQMFRRFAATVVLAARPPRDGSRRGRRLRVRRRDARGARDRPRRAQRQRVRLGHRPAARHDPRRPVGTSHAPPGHIWLDRGLLVPGRFAWATVMDEYAHQVDFSVLDPLPGGPAAAAGRERLVLRGRRPRPRSYGCERFSSMVAWAYWPSKESSYRPDRPATSRRRCPRRVPPAARRARRRPDTLTRPATR